MSYNPENNFKVKIVFLRELPFGDQDQFRGWPRQWSFLAVSDSEGRCQVEDFLAAMQGRLTATAVDMLAFLDGMVFEKEGPLRWIGTKRSHESVANERIFEFIMGDLRVHWFYGQGRSVVVLAIAALKKGNKTPKPLAKELIALRSNYEEAVKAGSVKLVKPPAGE